MCGAGWTPPTCGATPASATSPTSSAAATYDDPRVGPPAHTRPRPAPAPFSAPFPAAAPAPSRAPTPAAPPVRLGPARQGPLTLGPGGGAGRAAFPSRARAGRVSIACCAPGLAAALGLLALDADDSRAPKGSLRKFLEHLSGAGKAIGVLTSGGHDQDVHTEAVQAALAKHKEWKMAVPMPSKRRSLVVQTSMDAYTPPASTCVQPDLADVLQRPWTRAALFHQCGIRELPPGKCQVMVTSTRRHS
ncbi:uncharacterized protein LOC144338331 [Macaca mulatta]